MPRLGIKLRLLEADFEDPAFDSAPTHVVGAYFRLLIILSGRDGMIESRQVGDVLGLSHEGLVCLAQFQDLYRRDGMVRSRIIDREISLRDKRKASGRKAIEARWSSNNVYENSPESPHTNRIGGPDVPPGQSEPGATVFEPEHEVYDSYEGADTNRMGADTNRIGGNGSELVVFEPESQESPRTSDLDEGTILTKTEDRDRVRDNLEATTLTLFDLPGGIAPEPAKPKRKKATYDCHFEEWWALWRGLPKNVTNNKAGAHEAYIKAIQGGYTHEHLIEGVERWRSWIAGDPDRMRNVPMAERWLKNRRWEDDLPTLKAGPQSETVSDASLRRLKTDW